MDNVCEKKETPERLRGSPAASVSRPFVLRKKLFQGEGKRVFAGLHNLQLVLISKSKHLKGQLDPPVSDSNVFGPKEVSWTPCQ